MTNLDRAEFICTLPEIKSAIIIGSDGMQVKLEIPESNKGEGVKLAAMTGKQLRVVVEVVPDKELRVQGHGSDFEDPYEDVRRPKRKVELK